MVFSGIFLTHYGASDKSMFCGKDKLKDKIWRGKYL